VVPSKCFERREELLPPVPPSPERPEKPIGGKTKINGGDLKNVKEKTKKRIYLD
jgi:hypothetical protein